MHVEENVFYVEGGEVSAGGGDQLCAGCRLLPAIGGGGLGYVGPVCGNPELLTSHTLFSGSYKPLMPQKMLNLLWPRDSWGGETAGAEAVEGGEV